MLFTPSLESDWGSVEKSDEGISEVEERIKK